MKNNIRPTTLKGNDQINRMKGLMNITPINEDSKTSVVELTKKGPDGKVYGIVRENHKYFIKVTDKSENLVAEDFNYIGGLKNKTDKAYTSYSQATKQLNLKFLSLNEALEKGERINVLKNDNLLSENNDVYSENPKPSQPDSTLGTVKEMGKNEGHDDEIMNVSGDSEVSSTETVEEGTVNEKDDKDKVDRDSEMQNWSQNWENEGYEKLFHDEMKKMGYDPNDFSELSDDEKRKLFNTLDKKWTSKEESKNESVELTETEKAIDAMILEMKNSINDSLKITTAIGNIKKGENSSKKKV